MHFDLTAEQTAVLKLARDFAQGEVAPGAAERDESGAFPLDLVQKMGRLGFFGIPFSEEYGGMGGDAVSYAIAVEEISRADGSLGLTFAAHVSLGLYPVYSFGSPAQKERWLPGAIAAEYLASFGLTEPEAGSDAGNTQTTAVRDGDAWVLNGAKCFITNAYYSGYMNVTAVVDKDVGKHGISAFIVPRTAPGFVVGNAYKKMGLKSSDTRELSFTDCRIAADAMLGRPGEGFRQFMNTLDGGRISIGAMAVGLGQAALDAALAYAGQRVQFGRSISKFQAIQFKLADMAMELDLARTQVRKAAWLKDQKRPYTKEAAMAKLFASEAASRACNQAVQIHGGYGYMQEYPVERYLRDVKLCEIGEGTSEVQRLVIARELGC